MYKRYKGDIEKPINNTAYTCSYSIVFIISNFETILDENIVKRLKGKNIWSHNTGGKGFYICSRKIITDYESRSSLILKIVINLKVVWCHRCYIGFVKQTIFKVFYFFIKKICVCVSKNDARIIKWNFIQNKTDCQKYESNKYW